MLHILWLILKAILILLGVLLGLVLLLVLLLLFCPVRYYASAGKQAAETIKEAQLTAGVSWLFHIISFRLVFCNGELSKRIALFGIPIDKLLSKWADSSKGSDTKNKDAPDKETKANHNAAHTKEELNEELLQEDTEILQTTGLSEQELTENRIVEFLQEETGEKPDTELPQEEPAKGMNEGQQVETEQTDERKSLFGKIIHLIKTLFFLPAKIVMKIISIVKSIVGKINHVRLTIGCIYTKIDWWKKLIFHQRTKAALSLIWTDAKGLIRHILPKKLRGNIVFDHEDPYITGTILAVLGMSIPMHKNTVKVTPLFQEQNYLEGNVKLKGRIYGAAFVKAGLEIYFNRNVKYVLGRLKHKEVS